MLRPTPKLTLFADEKIVRCEAVEFSSPARLMDPEKVLAQLCQVESLDSHNLQAPMASLALHKGDPASLHLFETLFGRDSLITSRALLPLYPQIAAITLIRLAQYQGERYNRITEEEPGKILHEHRAAANVRHKSGWQFPYYGSIDATPLFINLTVEYCNRYGLEFLATEFEHVSGQTRTLEYAWLAAVDWLTGSLHASHLGLLEYCAHNRQALNDHVWKDHFDAYHHADGTVANHTAPIASVEVQGLAYDALLAALDLLEQLLMLCTDDEQRRLIQARNTACEHAAIRLQYSTMDHFVAKNSLGYYFVLGLDRSSTGRVRQLNVLSSNMGQALNSHLLDDEPVREQLVEGIVRNLFAPAMLSSFGVRTLAECELRYRPSAYHNGSVWLFDNYLIAQGLRHHGYEREAKHLENKIVEVVETTRLYPEFLSGDNGLKPELNRALVEVHSPRDRRNVLIMQPPQLIQAWTVAAYAAIKARLGAAEDLIAI